MTIGENVALPANRAANGATTGLFVCLGFGGLWLFWALSLWAARPFWAVETAVSAGIALALLTAVRLGALRQAMSASATPARPFTGPLYVLIVVAEFASILGAVDLLPGRPDLQLEATAAIVAVHFLPLGWLFRVRAYGWMALVMLCWIGVCFAVLTDRTLVAVATGIGMGAILWASAALFLIGARRR